ncbi:aldehyde dehydrogenase [Pseudofrankia asymbiotica]|uniref:Aldehyde dehydrogenase n=1 Tax=Pseudofrankia asymbiotica TaxID=1834516 RepID=A0A1V2IFP8_9ACTN|nr:aldehyde dehydrogenase [Pseudofrankia asymbiotica]ONH31719.1 aldehyde dehydrogenase [Pseudofrankia asymbiotica]
MIEHDTLFINGGLRPPHSRRSIDVVSPATEETIGRAPDADDVDVAAAVAAARSALGAGFWANRKMTARIDVVEAALTALEAKADEIAHLVTSEMGMPISMSQQMHSAAGPPGALANGRHYLELARQLSTEEYRPGVTPALVWREPVGVVAAIAPWNGPFNMAINKIVPALLSGCSIIFKPAPETPFDVFYLADALATAGLPAGVLGIVTGGRETGRELVSHPGVDKVSFTGSTAAGRTIGEICGRSFRRTQLELGGKSAAIILEDADLPTVLAGLGAGCFVNSGQACLSYSRILAPRSRYGEVVESLAAVAGSLVVGDPFDPATSQGPLVAQRQRARVESYIASAREDGATIVAGGGRPADLPRGWYIEPTVIADTTNDMKINREEIFGPVASVISYEDVDEAIALANDSDFGLHGAVFTGDDETALRVARAVRTGTFTINGFSYNTEAPFGGVKNSGIGRDTSREGLDAFFELKTVNLSPSLASRRVAYE